MTDEGDFEEAFHVPQQSRRDKLRVVVLQSSSSGSQYYPSSTSTTTTTTTSCEDQAVHHHFNGGGGGHHYHLLPVASLYESSDHLPTTTTHILSAGNRPLLVGGGGGGGGGDHHRNHDDNACKLQQGAAPLICVSSSSTSGVVVKEEGLLGLGVNLMAGFGGGGGGGGGLLMNTTASTIISSSSSSSSSSHHNPAYNYMDPHHHDSSLAVNLNPSSSISILHNNHPYHLYTSSHDHINHNPRDFDHHHQFFINNCGGGGGADHDQGGVTLFKQPQTLSLTNEQRTNTNNIVQTGGGGLSLSLSSSHIPPHGTHYNHHQALELNNLPPLRYHDQSPSPSSMMFDDKSSIGGAYVMRGVGDGGCSASASASTSNDYRSRGGPVPDLGPFTGYASILKESRFLKPAQQLLEESCDVVGGGGTSGTTGGIYHHVDHRMISGGGGDDDESPPPPPPHYHHQMENLSGPPGTTGIIGGDTRITSSRDISTSSDPHDQNHHHHPHQSSKKTSRLISMLDEVYRRYKQYYQQMVAIVASFESVAGLGNAAPYTLLALKAMSKHFKCLKNAITDQLYFTSKDSSEGSLKKDEYSRFGMTDQHVQSQRPSQGAGILERQHVWRPQRGLPERAVAVLRAWLFEHFLHPYPTDTDKQMLAKQTGLSRSQVSNWFINARVRLWKPMVEEIHMLETRQSQKASEGEDDQNINKLNEPLTATNSLASDKQPQSNPASTFKVHHRPPLKRSGIELSPLVPDKNTNDPMNFSCNNFSSYQHVSSVGGISNAGANNGVSLTLGLRQNNGTGLSGAPNSFPMNIAQRFGIEADDNEGYISGAGFEASNNRHYGKDIGGQLLHDFVG